MAETVTMTLTTPIQAHGEQLTQLELRCPTVKELRQCGAPYGLGDGGGVNYEACAQLLAMICHIPPSSVDQLAARDFDQAAWRLVGFMSPSPEDATTASTGS